MVEITETKSDTLQGFDSVVAAFGETVGIRAIKSVKNIGFPVLEHPSASLELRKFQTVTGSEPFGEQFRRSGTALCVHESKEQFLQRISLVQCFRKLRST